MIRLDAATRVGAAAPASRARHWLLFTAAALVFSYLFVNTAWVVDDAYITFRTIANLLSGHGLTWNIGERVQAYTHPLWMFVLSAAVALTGEFFKTSLAVSYLACLAALAVAVRSLRPDFLQTVVFALLFVTSKSVIDYASSGLENPLTYLFIVLFYSTYLAERDDARPREHVAGWLVLIATLSYLNRQDTILLYAPALVDVLRQGWQARRWRVVPAVLLAASPAVAWLVFSTFYYGSPVPNTAIAKMFSAELPLSARMARGAIYFLITFRWDALGFLAIAWAAFVAIRRGAWRPLAGVAGIALYLAYVWISASAATHMAGRFFAVPFVLAFYICARVVRPSDVSPAALVMLAAYVVVNPVASWKLNTPWYQTAPRSVSGYIDTVWFAHREGTGLLPPPGATAPVVNVCLEDGEKFRATAEPLRVGGCGGGDPIGFFAFAAGPDKWVIDPLALPDPLLARLRPCVDFQDPAWRPGHFRREIPEGYVESVLSGTNRLSDPGLRQYYAVVRQIVSGPLWSADRLRAIAAFNAGRYDWLVAPYNRATAERASRRQCRF